MIISHFPTKGFAAIIWGHLKVNGGSDDLESVTIEFVVRKYLRKNIFHKKVILLQLDLKSVQHQVKQHTKPDIYSPCANPSLNLTATDKVKSTVEFITFYGNVQSLWMPFSSSHKCWEILEHYIRCSLHLMSRMIIW